MGPDQPPSDTGAKPQPARRSSKVLFAGTHGVTFSAQLKAAVEERRRKMETQSSPSAQTARPRVSVGAMKAIEGRRRSQRRSRQLDAKGSKPQDQRLSLKSALHQVDNLFR